MKRLLLTLVLFVAVPAPLLAAGDCGDADGSGAVTVTLAVPEPIGAASLALAYPASAVSLPGTGDAATARVTLLTSTALFNDGSPNDRETDVTFALIATDGLDDGDLLRVRFDCLGAAPAASQFGCTLADVFAPDGLTAVSGATCTVAVAAE